MKERDRYMVGLSKGMNCTSSKDVSLLLPGCTTEYGFDPSNKPKRDFLTWKEFWKARGY